MARLPSLHNGNRTQTRIGLLPASSLLLDPIPAPADVTVTLGAAISAAATTATVTALTAPIARGVSLFFVTGGATVGILRLAADAITGATTLAITPAANAIATGAVASHKGLVCVPGLTSTGFSVASQEQTVQEITCDEDVVAGELSGFTSGLVSSSTWTMPLAGNVRESSAGYQMIKMAALYASDGAYIYVEHQIQAIGGYTKSSKESGAAQLTQFDITSSGEGFVTFSSSAAGRGAPSISTPQVV